VKKLLFSIICLLALVALAPQALRAQDADQHARSMPSPDQVVAKMDSKLSLSDDQKAKITPIIADRQEKIKELAQSSERRRKKGREMKSIISDSDKKIEALLTNDQKQKYEELKQSRKEQMKERRAARQSGSSE
jgi:Spy/CpxP family protein refolding chaperone